MQNIYFSFNEFNNPNANLKSFRPVMFSFDYKNVNLSEIEHHEWQIHGVNLDDYLKT
jgi:hypothetical protein